MPSSSKQRNKSGSSTSTSRETRIAATIIQLKETFGVNIISVGLAVVAVWLATIVLGIPLNLTGVAILLVVGLGISLITNRTGSFSFSFAVVTTGLIAVIVEYFVPAPIISLFDPLTTQLKQIPGVPSLLGLPSLQLFAFSLAVVVFVWVLDIRVFSALTRRSGRPEAANADTVARALARRARRLIQVYLSIAVALGMLITAVFVDVTSSGVEFGAIVFEFIQQVPVIAAALGSDIIGWVALGGNTGGLAGVPVLGSLITFLSGLGPTGFAVIVGFLLVLAVLSERNQD